MVDARDKLTSLIRAAIEDEAGLELVTSPGRATARGGYPTTWMLAQNGTVTFLVIEAAWYHDSASFTLSGPAVDQAGEAFWAGRGLHPGRKHVTYGPLECRVFVPYADGARVDLLLAALPALAQARQDHAHGREAAAQLNTYEFDMSAVTVIKVYAAIEEQARTMIAGLNSIATRTSGDDIEAVPGLDVSTSDYDVVTVSPVGRAYLVSAYTSDGEELVSAPDVIPEPEADTDWPALKAGLAEADRALSSGSADAKHEALHGLAEAVRGLLDEDYSPPAAEHVPATASRLDFPQAPAATTPGRSAQAGAPGTAARPAAARADAQAPRPHGGW